MPYDKIQGIEFRLLACALKAKTSGLNPRDYAALAAQALADGTSDPDLCLVISNLWQCALSDQALAGVTAHNFLIDRGAKAAQSTEAEIADQVDGYWWKQGSYG